jgi:hypothetical protein
MGQAPALASAAQRVSPSLAVGFATTLLHVSLVLRDGITVTTRDAARFPAARRGGSHLLDVISPAESNCSGRGKQPGGSEVARPNCRAVRLGDGETRRRRACGSSHPYSDCRVSGCCAQCGMTFCRRASPCVQGRFGRRVLKRSAPGSDEDCVVLRVMNAAAKHIS